MASTNNIIEQTIILRQFISMSIAMVTIREVAHAVEIFDLIASPIHVDRALKAAGLNRKVLKSESRFLPYYIEAVIFEFMARALGDTNLCIRGAQAFDYSTFGAYSKYVLGACDLKTALVRGRRALPMTHPGSDIIVRTAKDHAILCFRPGIERIVGHQHIHKGAVSVMFNVFRHFLGSTWQPAWVELTESAGARVSDIEQIVGAEVRTGAAAPAIAFPIRELNTPNPTPQHPNKMITLNELPMLMGVTSPRGMRDIVTEVLRTQLELGDLSEESVAHRLLIGRRTLQRTLKSEGTCFRDVKTEFIQNRACALLSKTDLTIDKIAFSLGYSEPNNFRRSFKKWTGFSPGDYRATSVRSRLSG